MFFQLCRQKTFLHDGPLSSRSESLAEYQQWNLSLDLWGWVSSETNSTLIIKPNMLIFFAGVICPISMAWANPSLQSSWCSQNREFSSPTSSTCCASPQQSKSSYSVSIFLTSTMKRCTFCPNPFLLSQQRAPTSSPFQGQLTAASLWEPRMVASTNWTTRWDSL